MKITHKQIVPAIAAGGIAFMIYSVAASDGALPPSSPISAPAKPQFSEVVAGAGLVEASTQNILVGTQLPGVVAAVHVKVGDRVGAGDPLFTIDDRAHRADFSVREANMRVAEQNLARLSAWPRKEDVVSAKAKVAESQALANDAKAQLIRVEQVSDPRAIAKEEIQRRRFQADAAQARLEQAKASLALLEAGAWKEDLAVAQNQVTTARAQAKAAQTDLDRLIVRAPVPGEILQVNTRPGEYVANAAASSAPVVMGNTQLLHVRVDVDESDAWRVNPKALATASLRGASNIKTDLRFVRVEPFVVPKRSLTGGTNERVDTRVLQVLYSFERGNLPVYVGQQMDVFIDAGKTAPNPAAARTGKQGAPS
jgi:HlyD family secretion protein